MRRVPLSWLIWPDGTVRKREGGVTACRDSTFPLRTAKCGGQVEMRRVGREEWTLIKVGGNSTPAAAAEIVENDASSVWHYGFICCIWSGSTTHPDLVYPPSGRAHAVLVERMLRVGKVQESMRKHPTYIHFASYQSELCLEMDRSVYYGSIKDIFGLAAMS